MDATADVTSTEIHHTTFDTSLLGVCFFVLVGCGQCDSEHPLVFQAPDTRESCANADPLRQPFFGDLHVHTRLSFDANSWGTRTGPDDAYRFARGEEIGIFPYDEAGNALRTIALSRPLDFAAVTDHAEFFDATTICTDPESAGYTTQACVSYREGDGESLDFGWFSLSFLFPGTKPDVCVDGTSECDAYRDESWEEIRDAAERHYDRTSACAFTTFIGYEWSGVAGGLANIHRNIIFRNRTVPRIPTSFIEATTAEFLYDALDATCTNTGTGCEVLSIPHNANLGAGHMFVPIREDGMAYQRADAERRARLEPLLEIYQHKGASECVFGAPDPLASEDEFCNFEQLATSICSGSSDDPVDCAGVCSQSSGGGLLSTCVEPADNARGALRRGLAELARIDVNPFRLGFIGSTDTHASASGYVTEENWEGHLGDRDDMASDRLRSLDIAVTGINTNSPGGLAVLWAEENSRESLFAALQRRETYATSGTRLSVRFFGGWSFSSELCNDVDFVSVGYESGVPMGGELPARIGAAAPAFIVSALQDPGVDEFPGSPLQRIQIIKGWYDGAMTHERVFEIAGDPENGASVDPATCETSAAGFESLCQVWTDPEFAPSQPAFYYARVLENPVCRWSQRLCNAENVDCDAIEADDPLIACCDGSLPATIQERAWTSPIWYVPE